MLEKDSSILGYPGEVSKALDADHHTICKYDSPKDPRYMNVRDYLKKQITKFITLRSSKSSEDTDSSALALSLRELEAALSITEPADTDFVFFRDRWTSGTCEWIPEEETFDQWATNPNEDPRLLWLHGSAGSGKSVLTSFVVNHLVEKGRQCQYFFFRSADKDKKSLGTMLRSLALQVASAFPAFRLALSKIAPHLRLRGASPRLIWEKMFKAILFKLDFDGPMFWAFDGFDECDAPREGIKLLAEVLDTSVPIRILVTSRLDAEIGAEVRKLSQAARVSTLTMREHRSDYRIFLQQELEWSDVPAFNARITQRLLDMAQGSFLWLRLTVDRINKCYTESDVTNALRELPEKMEQLYNHMADSIARQSPSDQALTADILAWATCTLRSISTAELLEALNPDHPRILNLQRCIHDLCRGFVVVDNGETVSMVHQTAREYLLGSKDRPFNVNKKLANEKLFLRCLHCLTAQNLRGGIKRGDYPLFLPYATNSWGGHLLSSNPASEAVMKALRHFLGSASILTWIHAVAQFGQFHLLLQVSNYLSRFALHLKSHYASLPGPSHWESDLPLLEGWATELGKLAGKFGRQLFRSPDSIYEMIPPFCPEGSMIRRQFTRKGGRGLVVTGFGEEWDDSLARLSLPHGYEASGLAVHGDRIAVAATFTTNNTSTIFIYHSSTYQEVRALKLGQKLLSMKMDRSGSLLVTSGFSSTHVWNLTTGDCVACALNPPGLPRPKGISFSQDNEIITFATDDHKIWRMKIATTTSFELVTLLTERGNSPSCMSFSPDGRQVALGSRQRPLSIWTTETSQLVARCSQLTRVTHIVWHPYSGELFGVMMHVSGRVFKWHPDSQEIASSFLEVSRLVISSDGKLLALGNQYGNIRLLSTEDLSMVYQLDSQDPVIGLAFSIDTRQLYDIRESYGNVWEPNVLLKLSELAAPLTDDDSDIVRSDRLELDPIPGNYYTRIDPINSLAVQKQGRLYCSGTFSGVAALFDTEYGKLFELGRSQNFSIQQMAWSGDGHYVCYADVSRTIFVHSVSSSEGSLPATAERVLELSIRYMKDNINQLIFHPREPKILISSCTAAASVSIGDRAVVATQETSSESGKWINHPTDAHLLLFVSNSAVEIFSWSNLALVHSIPLLQTSIQLEGAETASPHESPTRLSKEHNELCVRRLLLSKSKKYLIVQNSRLGFADVIRILDITHLPTEGTQLPSKTPIPDVAVPSSLKTLIDKPLAILSAKSAQDTLVFLDSDSWVCTWPITTSPGGNSSFEGKLPQHGKIGGGNTRRDEQRDMSIMDRHYCLPGDWVSPDCLELVRVFDSGAILCPRNGEMAVVRCNTLVG